MLTIAILKVLPLHAISRSYSHTPMFLTLRWDEDLRNMRVFFKSQQQSPFNDAWNRQLLTKAWEPHHKSDYVQLVSNLCVFVQWVLRPSITTISDRRQGAACRATAAFDPTIKAFDSEQLVSDFFSGTTNFCSNVDRRTDRNPCAASERLCIRIW